MTVSVIAPVFGDSPAPASFFHKSAERLGIAVGYFGRGIAWNSWRCRLLLSLPAIAASHTDLVLMTDAFDVLMLRPAQDIADEYVRVGAPPLLLSAEKDCWPNDPELAQQYPHSPTPWAYINGGGWIGRRDYLLEKIPEVLAIDPDESNDQTLWAKAYTQGLLPGAKLDHWCRIFQTMSRAQSLDYVPNMKRLLNSHCGTYPCIAHFNGRTLGMEELWAKITGS